MCKWGNTVIMCVPIHADDSHTGAFRWADKAIDSCIADVVQALNDAGIYTRSSCCGHGRSIGGITLHDGRNIYFSERHPTELESIPVWIWCGTDWVYPEERKGARDGNL